jgi:hypothetical protein
MQWKHYVTFNVSLPPPPPKKEGGGSRRRKLTNELKCRHFLRVFAKLRKANVSFVISVRPSVCLHGTNSAPT